MAELLPSISEFIRERELIEDFLDYVDDVYNHLTEARGALFKYTRDPSKKEITKAIENREYSGIFYEGDDEEVKDGFRLIEPYVIGSGYAVWSKAGRSFTVSNPNRLYLRAYVIMDTEYDTQKEWTLSRRESVSKSNRKPYWRLFRVDRMKFFYRLPRKFSYYRPDYNPDDKLIANIDAAAQHSDFPYGKFKGK